MKHKMSLRGYSRETRRSFGLGPRSDVVAKVAERAECQLSRDGGDDGLRLAQVALVTASLKWRRNSFSVLRLLVGDVGSAKGECPNNRMIGCSWSAAS